MKAFFERPLARGPDPHHSTFFQTFSSTQIYYNRNQRQKPQEEIRHNRGTSYRIQNTLIICMLFGTQKSPRRLSGHDSLVNKYRRQHSKPLIREEWITFLFPSNDKFVYCTRFIISVLF